MENKKKILIVEDDESLRLILKDALICEKIFEIYDTSDGVSALEMVEKYSPDLAVIDIGIPRIDGLSLARMMSDKKFTAKTKILFLTNSSDISRISVASAIDGVIGYLIKADWDISEVVKQIKEKLK